MSCSGRAAFLLALPLAFSLSVASGHSSGRPGAHGRTGPAFGVVGGGHWNSNYHYGSPYYTTLGPNGLPMVYYAPPFWMPMPFGAIDGGPLGGPIPPPVFARPPAAAPRANAPRVDGPKSEQMITIGDRLFRAKNFKRAEERYGQAVRADPGAAAPRVRLAQLAVVRERYGEAAERFREAVAAEPDWLARAPDIQAVYGEPAEFNRQIARLESHLLLEPGDRDAWLVLGAQLYLSGQTRRAGDVFLRLTDRQPDPALAAFLEATRPPVADAR